jgi:hypothetical protein
MKASDAKNPVFSPAWWKKNRGLTVKEVGLEKALKEYEDACKARKDSADTYRKILGALESVKSASAATIKACNATLHKETLEAAENYRRKAEAAHKALRPVVNALGEIDKIKSVADLMKHKDFKDYCKKVALVEENHSFLQLMAKSSNKGNLAVYELFIKAGSKWEINIDSVLRKKFDAFDSPNAPKKWDEAPWAEAVDAIQGLTQSDTLPKFKKWLLEQATKDVFKELP